MKDRNRCRIDRAVVVITVLLLWPSRPTVASTTAASITPAPATAESITPASTAAPRTRPVVLLGLGAATVSNPDSRFENIDPQAGYRAGVLLAMPARPHVQLDVGVVVDHRSVNTRSISGSWMPESTPVVRKSSLALRSFAFPIHARVDLGSAGAFRPYVAGGPEVSVLLKAWNRDHEVTNEVRRWSWGAYLGFGALRPVGSHDLLLELGLSAGLQGMGGDYEVMDGPPGLGDSKSRLFLFSAGMQF